MATAAPAVRRARADYLDLFKTLLVVGMIVAHVAQLIGFGLKPEMRAYSAYINLVTFSGFMFAFGLGVGLQGPNYRSRSVARKLWPAGLMLVSVYVSSLGFALLVEGQEITPEMLFDLLTLRWLFGYSEFLATFFVLYLLVAFGRRWLLEIGQNPAVLLVVGALCLYSTLLVVSEVEPVAGALLSNWNYPNFPLVPYLPWFLLGIFFGLRDLTPKPWHLLLAAAITAAFYWVTWTWEEPRRFPPTALWIVGPTFFLLVMLLLCQLIGRSVRIPSVLLLPGRHVLSFLVLSNLTIFFIRDRWNQPLRNSLSMVLAGLAIVAALMVLWAVIDAVRQRKSERTALPGLDG